MAMLTVPEAHARVIALFETLSVERVDLAEAAGRVLARPVTARRAQPPFRSSAMDGYALRGADGSPGAVLRVIAESTAGERFAGAVGEGEAVRIFTGAPVPDGADTILIQEDAEVSGDGIVVRGDLGAGTHIRPAGGDFHEGARFEAPRRLSARDISLLAAMNAPRLEVVRRPVVALIPTGNELVMPGEEPGPDQILSSNGFGLKALLEGDGAEVRLLPIARDTVESLDAVFALARGADLIVTLGGASVGDYDLVEQTATARGLDLSFYKIAMRPGKPLMAGRLEGSPMVGLPGNPVSAMVCAEIFLRPAIARMLGLDAALPARIAGKLARPLDANGPREHYMRATVTRTEEGWLCDPSERQDSSLLSVLASANALMVRPAGDPARSAGSTVEFILL